MPLPLCTLLSSCGHVLSIPSHCRVRMEVSSYESSCPLKCLSILLSFNSCESSSAVAMEVRLVSPEWSSEVKETGSCPFPALAGFEWIDVSALSQSGFESKRWCLGLAPSVSRPCGFSLIRGNGWTPQRKQ